MLLFETGARMVGQALSLRVFFEIYKKIGFCLKNIDISPTALYNVNRDETAFKKITQKWFLFSFTESYGDCFGAYQRCC